MKPTKFDRMRVLELAAASACDPRTVAKFLRGEIVRGLAADRIRRALETNPLRFEATK